MSGEEIPAVGSSAARRRLFLSRCVKGATHLSVIVVTLRTAEAASPTLSPMGTALRFDRRYTDRPGRGSGGESPFRRQEPAVEIDRVDKNIIRIQIRDIDELTGGVGGDGARA